MFLSKFWNSLIFRDTRQSSSMFESPYACCLQLCVYAPKRLQGVVICVQTHYLFIYLFCWLYFFIIFKFQFSRCLHYTLLCQINFSTAPFLYKISSTSQFVQIFYAISATVCCCFEFSGDCWRFWAVFLSGILLLRFS